MRVVVDTNIAISGLLWRGAPRRPIDAARASQFELATSPELLTELKTALAQQKLAAQVVSSGFSLDELVRQFEIACVVVASPSLPNPVSTDPDDDIVLACALAARADFVSGDRHLLALRS